MQTNLFEAESELTLEERVLRLRNSAFQVRINELLENGFIYSCLGKAREIAKQIRQKGILCKSTNKHTIKLLK